MLNYSIYLCKFIILITSPLTGVTIGFTVNYTMVSESVGNVTLVVDILEGTVAPNREVVVTAMTVDGSAKGKVPFSDALRVGEFGWLQIPPCRYICSNTYGL